MPCHQVLLTPSMPSSTATHSVVMGGGSPSKLVPKGAPAPAAAAEPPAPKRSDEDVMTELMIEMGKAFSASATVALMDVLAMGEWRSCAWERVGVWTWGVKVRV